MGILFRPVLAATVLYLVDALGVTAFGSIPLNEALDGLSIPLATAEEIAVQWEKFEGPWRDWHTVRAAASLVTLLYYVVNIIIRSVQIILPNSLYNYFSLHNIV